MDAFFNPKLHAFAYFGCSTITMSEISIFGIALFVLLVIGAFGYGFMTLVTGFTGHYYDRFCLFYFSYVDRRP